MYSCRVLIMQGETFIDIIQKDILETSVYAQLHTRKGETILDRMIISKSL